MKPKPEEKPLWITVLKLILLATTIIGGTGLALWYVAQHQQQQQIDPTIAPVTPSSSWGLANDSPLKPKR